MKKKPHTKEAICSLFIVGLGQIIKGDSQRGLKYVLWFYIAIPALIFTLLHLNGILFLIGFSLCLIGYPIFWIYNIYNAAK